MAAKIVSSRSLVVMTQHCDCCNPGSNPGGGPLFLGPLSFSFFLLLHRSTERVFRKTRPRPSITRELESRVRWRCCGRRRVRVDDSMRKRAKFDDSLVGVGQSANAVLREGARVRRQSCVRGPECDCSPVRENLSANAVLRERAFKKRSKNANKSIAHRNFWPMVHFDDTNFRKSKWLRQKVPDSC